MNTLFTATPIEIPLSEVNNYGDIVDNLKFTAAQALELASAQGAYAYDFLRL